MNEYIKKYGFDKIEHIQTNNKNVQPEKKEQTVKIIIVDNNENEINNYLDLLKKDNLIKLCDILELKYVKN